MFSSVLCLLSHLLLFGDIAQRDVFPSSWDIEAVCAPHHLFSSNIIFFLMKLRICSESFWMQSEEEGEICGHFLTGLGSSLPLKALSH